MTKSQLCARLARELPAVPQRDVEATVDAVFECMAGALRKNDRIEIRGFGTFGIRARGAKEGRNPRTGDRIAVPARRTAFFVPGKQMRARLNSPAAPRTQG